MITCQGIVVIMVVLHQCSMSLGGAHSVAEDAAVDAAVELVCLCVVCMWVLSGCMCA